MVTLFGSMFVLKLIFGYAIGVLKDVFYTCFSYAGESALDSGMETLSGLRLQSLVALIKTAGPMLLTTMALSIGATLFQTRLMVSGELLRPKFSRISPLQGFKRLFSLRSVVEAVKGLLKISILLYLIYSSLFALIGVTANYLDTELTQICGHMFSQIYAMMQKVAIAFLALAAIDYLYQWWDYERQLKMSKQEIKEEYKQMEGDPQVKSRIKEVQRKMSQARMMRQVPDADVVVRNPSHFAVALRYKAGEDQAPVVLAKGQDELALRIVKTAEENNVAVVENVPLARALYAQAELDREIPPELYAAVAELLVYLYRLDSTQQKTPE